MKKLINNREFKRYFFMVISSFIYALSLSQFFAPNNIVAGGLSGLAIVLNYLMPFITVGTFNLLVNIPVLLLGFKVEGWKFILRCLLTIGLISIFTDLTGKFTPITDDKVLATLYGGILQGLSIGMFCKFSVSSGGTELLGRVIYKKLKSFPITYFIYMLDALVVFISVVVFKQPENILYAIIIIYISLQLSDKVIVGFQSAKLCYIITEKADEIGDFLVANSPRGVSNFTGQGVYSKRQKNMLMTVIKRKQLVKLKEWVYAIDEKAFVIVSDTTEVLGNGFKGINDDNY